METEIMDENSWWSKNAKVYLEEGGLYGVVLIYSTPPDELTLTLNGLKDFLNSSGIQFGIDVAICQQLILSPNLYIKERVRIAKGVAPIMGNDAVIQINVEENGESKPRLLENGRVDYFDLGTMQLVKKGQVLAVRIPPTEGKDGFSVNGKPITSKQGRDFRLPQGRNTVTENDGCTLISEIDGHVVYTPKDNKIHVFSEYIVQQDVDFSVGNIEFNGSVRVRGNVQSGFKLKAEGDIEIQGYMDAALIEAGGDIIIHGGIQGRNKGVVRAGGSLRTPFIQNAKVDVNGSCIVGENIMHSQINAGKKIIMEGRKAVIVGGIVRAGEEVVTRVLGSPMATPTEVEMGVHPHLRTELSSLHESLKELNKNIDKTEKAIALLENLDGLNGNLPPDKKAMLQKLKITHEHYKVEEEDLLFRRSEIEMVLQEVKSSRVNVLDTVHSGVKITINNYVYYVRDSISHVSFVIKDAELRVIPL